VEGFKREGRMKLHIEKLREASDAIQPAATWTTDPHKESGRAAHRTLEEAISLTRMYTESREREVANLESENQRLRTELQRIIDADRNVEHAAALDPEAVATVISRAGEYHAHANTRPHAVAAAHGALAILAEGGHPDKVGCALVKEMSKWLESTRRAILEQAAQTVSALR
jgi:hypothetical protein